jgi:hypothetical protein
VDAPQLNESFLTIREGQIIVPRKEVELAEPKGNGPRKGDHENALGIQFRGECGQRLGDSPKPSVVPDPCSTARFISLRISSALIAASALLEEQDRGGGGGAKVLIYHICPRGTRSPLEQPGTLFGNAAGVAPVYVVALVRRLVAHLRMQLFERLVAFDLQCIDFLLEALLRLVIPALHRSEPRQALEPDLVGEFLVACREVLLRWRRGGISSSNGGCRCSE